MKIYKLDISVSAKRLLLGAGYREVEELVGISEETLSEICHMDPSYVVEIRRAVDEYSNTEIMYGVDFLNLDMEVGLTDINWEDSPERPGFEEIGDDTPLGKSYNAMDWYIEEMELSCRAYNCLKRAGIETVAELCEKSLEDMMNVQNLGRKSLEEIIEKLRELGLELKGNGEVL